MEVDAAFAIDARKFFRDFFVFHRHEAWQHFDDGDFAIERAIDRSELDSYSARAHDYQRLRNFFQAEDFDVGENAVVGFEARDHAGFRTGRENDVLRLEFRGLPVVRDLDRVHAILRGPGELAVAADGLDLILLHQEFETLGVLGHDFSFAILDGGPVQLAGVDAFDAELFRFFEVIPQLGVEQQRLGWNATDVQAGAAENVIFFDECGLQAVLAGADGGSVSGRAAADNGDVINGFWQGCPQ